MAIAIDGANGIQIAAGSVSDPALKSTDTDTGIYFSSSNVISVAIDGSEIATISSSGIQQNGSSLLTSSDIDVANVLFSANIGSEIQPYDVDTAKLDVSQTWAADQNLSDYFVQRSTLKDYAIEGSAIGNVGATRTFDLETANFFSATVDQASTFTFSNPPASGDFGAFVIELTNGGAFLITWPAAVDWPGGTAPTLTASGVDQLVFTTRDAGTTWFGFVAGLDINRPDR